MHEQTRARAGASRRFRRSTPPPPPLPAETPGDVADFRDLLTNGVLVPLHLVLLTRERIQEVMDDAVNRGRMTRDDANEVVQGLLRRGRKETEEVLADLDRLLSRGVGEIGAAAGATRERATRAAQDAAGRARSSTKRVAETAMAQAERARGMDRGFPIAGYDDLNASQVQTRLEGLPRADLRKVRDYEKRNANRKSVLGPLSKRLG